MLFIVFTIALLSKHVNVSNLFNRIERQIDQPIFFFEIRHRSADRYIRRKLLLNYKSDVGHLSETMLDFAEESMHLNNNIDSIKEAVDAVNIAVEESAKGIVGVTGMASDMTVSMENIKVEAEGNREIAGQLESEVEKFKL